MKKLHQMEQEYGQKFSMIFDALERLFTPGAPTLEKDRLQERRRIKV